MRAFEQAIEDGADGIELDVRASRDGEVMVFHDATLARLAGRPERVGALSAHELLRVELERGERMCTLNDVLDRLEGTRVLLNIEIKGDGGRRFHLTSQLASLLRRRRRTETIAVSSFRPEILVWLRALGHVLPRGFLFDGENTGKRRAQLLEWVGRFDVVHPQFRLVNEASMARWRAAGKLVNVWTVDAPEELKRVADLGVDGIITNHPRAAREALRSAGHCGAGSAGL